jgi:hypothetical protein
VWEERKGLVFLYVAMRADNERSERWLDGAMTLILRP